MPERPIVFPASPDEICAWIISLDDEISSVTLDPHAMTITLEVELKNPAGKDWFIRERLPAFKYKLHWGTPPTVFFNVNVK